MSLRSRISPVVHWAGFTGGISTRMARGQRVARVFAYNYTNEDFTPGLLTRELEYLGSNFSVVPLAALAQRLRSGQLEGNEIVLTFDNGYRRLATEVCPLLQKLNLPATFFVCPGLIETRQWIWNDEAHLRLLTMNQMARHALSASLGAPSAEVYEILYWLKSLPPKRREFSLQKLREKSPAFAPTPEQIARFELMTWEELLALDPQRITIGSHSMTHAVLTNLEPPEIQVEVVESRRMLEARLGRPVEFFAYSNEVFSDLVLGAVRRTYTAALTVEHRAVQPKEFIHRLPRVLAVPSLSKLAWKLHHPAAV